MTQKINYNNIDNNMVKIIKELNRKGYETMFCCEGHWNEHYQGYMGAYIYFKNPIPKNLMPTLGFRYDESKMWHQLVTNKSPFMQLKEGSIFYWTLSRYKRMTREQKDKEHEEFIGKLEKWVDNLPIL